MNALLKFSKKSAAPVILFLASCSGVLAQNPVESIHIDEKYAYTTVVYKNNAAADKDVLSSLDNHFSVGDVICVTLAPPPAPIAASEPVHADRIQMPDSGKWGRVFPGGAELPSSALNEVPQTPMSTVAAPAKPLPVETRSLAPTTIPVPKPVETVGAVTEQNRQTGVAPSASISNPVEKAKSSRVKKAGKAPTYAKKSGKKSGQKVRLKNRKPGKQRYSCPKF